MSVHDHIANFLKENGYYRTLQAFKDEHGAPIDTNIVASDEIDSVLIDKLKELSTSKDRNSTSQKSVDTPWMVDQPQLRPWTQSKLSFSSKLPPIDGLVIDCAINSNGLGVFATATRRFVVVNLKTGQTLMDSKNIIGNFVVRKVEFVDDYLVMGGINGLVQTARLIDDSSKLELIDSVQAHERLIIDMKVVRFGNQTLVATLGWDKYVQVFQVNTDGKLQTFLERILISGVGSCLEAFCHEATVFIVIGLRESSILDVVTIESEVQSNFKVATSDVEYSSIRSLPMCLSGAIVPGLGPVIAVATSHEPYMRVILLSLADLAKNNSDVIHRSQILANFNTMSPQDKYSEAKICFRPNGEGIWILGDDGILRGLELKSGSIVQEIDAHDGRIKALALRHDTMITCGIDREIKLWNGE